MSAELSRKNGVAEMLYFGETPWHREGHKFEVAPTWDDLKKVTDYDLEKQPYYYPAAALGAEPGPVRMKPSDDAFYIIRKDTGAILGTVGKDYHPITNSQAFAVLKPLVEEGLMTIETAGVLRDGADAWLLGRWDLSRFGPIAQEVLGPASGDPVQPFATVMANHSGRRSVLIGQTPIRVVCANTLGAAETDAAANSSRWASIRHTENGKVRLVEEAERLFKGVVERYETISRHYKLLKGTPLTQDEFNRFVIDVVLKDPTKEKGWNPEAKLAKSVLERFERKRDRLKTLWVKGKGHTGDENAWFAYNAVCEALDHDRGLWPTRAGCYRTAQLLTGDYADKKNTVLDRLTAHAIALAS